MPISMAQVEVRIRTKNHLPASVDLQPLAHANEGTVLNKEYFSTYCSGVVCVKRDEWKCEYLRVEGK